MKKRVYAIIGLVIALVMVFTACSAGKSEEAANGTTDVSETVSVLEESTTELTTEEATTETTTEATAAAATQSATQAQTTARQTTKAQTTAKQTTAAPKQTTTQKPTTTVKPTTVKNVTPQEVQSQANAYIKSKGITLNSSMTPDLAGWSTRISTRQDYLNDGGALNSCKGFVNQVIQDVGVSGTESYCYYDGTWLYILYW